MKTGLIALMAAGLVVSWWRPWERGAAPRAGEAADVRIGHGRAALPAVEMDFSGTGLSDEAWRLELPDGLPAAAGSTELKVPPLQPGDAEEAATDVHSGP